MKRPCACGHDENEHGALFDPAKYKSLPDGLKHMQMCSGNTWAYPVDAEGDRDGREVRCHCRCYTPADDHDLDLWSLDVEDYEAVD